MADKSKDETDTGPGASDPNPITPSNQPPSATPPVETEDAGAAAVVSGVKYIVPGIHVRQLSIQDLQRMGAESPEADLEWNDANGMTVSAAELNQSTVDALLRSGEFVTV